MKCAICHKPLELLSKLTMTISFSSMYGVLSDSARVFYVCSDCGNTQLAKLMSSKQDNDD